MTGPPEGKTSPNTCKCCLAAIPGRACARITRDPTAPAMPGNHNPTLGANMPVRRMQDLTQAPRLKCGGGGSRVAQVGKGCRSAPINSSRRALRISTRAARIKRMSKPESIAPIATSGITTITQQQGDSCPQRYMHTDTSCWASRFCGETLAAPVTSITKPPTPAPLLFNDLV